MKSPAYLILLALPILNAQQSPERTVGGGAIPYPIEQEVALGAQAASDFQSKAQVLDDSQVNSYVRSIGDKLLKQLPDPGFAIHFAVFVDGQTSGVREPITLPGGYIYVPETLILTARNEAEFAGMFAHAICHSTSRHPARLSSQQNAASVGAIPTIVSGGWAGYDMRQASGMAIPIGLMQFRRGLELEADHRAVPVIAAAGWDPEAFAAYIEREQVPDPRMPGSASQVFSPLPPREERVAAIRKAISELPPRGYSPSPEFAAVQSEVRRLDAARAPKTAPPSLNAPRQR